MRLPTAMENHTPEPWVKKGSTVISPSRGGLTVEEYDEQTWTYYGGYLIAESITDANARRIVACVNACAGIPSEALEAGAIREMREAIEIALGEVRHAPCDFSRDEKAQILRKALEKAKGQDNA